ncbi:MAG: MarR family winged helix-turn-helix transcriptional regulator [Micromonosporaceae bacterium]
MRDSVDDHVEHWQHELPDLDPAYEGPVTRMQYLVKHLKQHRQALFAASQLASYEYDTLQLLVGRGEPYQLSPSELAAQSRMSPAAITGRLDGLEARGYLRRIPHPDDRRKVIVQLTPEGRAIWEATIRRLGDEELRLLDTLTARELAQLDGLLRKLLTAAEAR